MADHFRVIGFGAPSAEALSSLVGDLIRQGGEKLPCPSGFYQRLATAAGAELWVHMQETGERSEGIDPSVVAGITPFFHGEGRSAIRIRAVCHRASDNAFEGAFYIEFGPTIALVDVVDFARVFRTQTPFMALAQIVAFPHDLAVFETLAAFETAQDGKDVKFSPRSFLASGLFLQAPGGEVRFVDPEEPGFDAPSRAFLTGEVQKAEVRQNPLTGQSFTWAVVATAGGTVDLVADATLLNQPLLPGAVVQGEVWLCAKLV